MKKIRLESMIRIHYGRSLKADERVTSGMYPVYGSNGEVGTHNRSLVTTPTLVIGRKGSVGSVTFAPKGGWVIDTAFYTELIAPESVYLRYLYYALIEAKLDKHTITTSIPGLSRDDIYRTIISLPPLSEQKRIAAILDKADAIRRKRAQAQQLADQFLQSVFLNTVGPLAPKYDTWKLCSFEQLSAPTRGSMRTGPFGSNLKHSEFVNEGICVLGIDNAVQNHFRWAERRYITEEKYEDLRKYTVYPKDVIITIMGTTGRSAVVPDDIPLAVSTKHLATITCNTRLVCPEFLSFCIHSHPSLQQQISAANKGAIMAGLNLDIIKKLNLNLPPVETQKAFVELLYKTERTRSKYSKNIDETNNLFACLCQNAFSGDL